MEHILTQQDGHIFEIILNRPDKRNAIRVQMLQGIAEAVMLAEQTPDVRVIIVRGEGGCFSAGIDLLSMGGAPEALNGDWQKHVHTITRMWQDSIYRLHQSPLPTIALLHSYTLGGGLEIALGCDLRIAADDAILSLEEARLGLIPDAGGTTHLTRLLGAARAKELIFTGRRIDAGTAERWGLVNQVVPRADLPAAGRKLADEIAQSAPLAIAAAKRTINAIEPTAEPFYLEMREQYALLHSQDVGEGMQAALERRPPQWKGR